MAFPAACNVKLVITNTNSVYWGIVIISVRDCVLEPVSGLSVLVAVITATTHLFRMLVMYCQQ